MEAIFAKVQDAYSKVPGGTNECLQPCINLIDKNKFDRQRWFGETWRLLDHVRQLSIKQPSAAVFQALRRVETLHLIARAAMSLSEPSNWDEPYRPGSEIRIDRKARIVWKSIFTKHAADVDVIDRMADHYGLPGVVTIYKPSASMLVKIKLRPVTTLRPLRCVGAVPAVTGNWLEAARKRMTLDSWRTVDMVLQCGPKDLHPRNIGFLPVGCERDRRRFSYRGRADVGLGQLLGDYIIGSVGPEDRVACGDQRKNLKEWEELHKLLEEVPLQVQLLDIERFHPKDNMTFTDKRGEHFSPIRSAFLWLLSTSPMPEEAVCKLKKHYRSNALPVYKALQGRPKAQKAYLERKQRVLEFLETYAQLDLYPDEPELHEALVDFPGLFAVGEEIPGDGEELLELVKPSYLTLAKVRFPLLGSIIKLYQELGWNEQSALVSMNNREFSIESLIARHKGLHGPSELTEYLEDEIKPEPSFTNSVKNGI